MSIKCLQCKNEKFREEKVRFYPMVKNKQLDVLAYAMMCTKCGKAMMNSGQMDELLGAIKLFDITNASQIAICNPK